MLSNGQKELHDFIQLHDGWQQAESIIFEQDIELAKLKGQFQELQDACSKSRAESEAFESIKELTTRLEGQIGIFRQENMDLKKKNDYLNVQYAKSVRQLRTFEEVEQIQSTLLTETQVRLEATRNHNNEYRLYQSDMQMLAQEEQSMRVSAEDCIQKVEREVEKMKYENKMLRGSLDKLILKMSQCDEDLSHISKRFLQASQETASIPEMIKSLPVLEQENRMLKIDICRVVQMLERIPTAITFTNQWHDSAEMTFVGLNIHTDFDVDRFNRKLRPHADNGVLIESNWLQCDPSDPHHLTDSNSRNSANLAGYQNIIYSGDIETKHDISNLSVLKSSPLGIRELCSSPNFQTSPITLNKTSPSTLAFLEDDSSFEMPPEDALLGLHFLSGRLQSAPQNEIRKFLRNINKIPLNTWRNLRVLFVLILIFLIFDRFIVI